MKCLRKESGEVMIEGMIVMVITLLLLVWILGVGFIYYQRYVTNVITNDAAAKIAATYYNPDSDIIMGYIDAEDFAERDLYRGFDNNDLVKVNEGKAAEYIEYMLNKTNFVGTVKEVDVKLKPVKDSALRKHVEVTTTCTFNTPFGEGLAIFGMKDTDTYRCTGRADCTDIMDYISTTDFAAYQLSGAPLGEKVISMINSLIKVFNHNYAKS